MILLGKSQLANKLGMSWKMLKRRIENNSRLLFELKKCGYSKTSKNFTPREAKLISEEFE